MLAGGFGWMMVGRGRATAQTRSIVDRMVGAPERLIFEGAIRILAPPLAQDRESRRPMLVDGAPLDTITTCPPLTALRRDSEAARSSKRKKRNASRPNSAKARTAGFVAAQAKRLAPAHRPV